MTACFADHARLGPVLLPGLLRCQLGILLLGNLTRAYLGLVEVVE